MIKFTTYKCGSLNPDATETFIPFIYIGDNDEMFLDQLGMTERKAQRVAQLCEMCYRLGRKTLMEEIVQLEQS